jgi:hypothetical protein
MMKTATPHQPRKLAAKQWTIECTWNCGNVITTPRKPPAMLGCDYCNGSHTASAAIGHEGNTVRRTVTTIRNGV